ncbi:hypothetical protein CV102_10360 [Natronococcus pandeyae]|uniref:WD40 repeat domain-containing protein n=2 Tax=Natronococcus pandeyae TaxID=2055836 RepID=A0A8J8TQH6_9EURY|nr:hypothetical protein CV102_10360 [Natronococcus pandeyae]
MLINIPQNVRGNVHSEGGISLRNDPYADVEWDDVGRHRGEFHVHTTAGQYRWKPHEAIDLYNEEYDTDILALAPKTPSPDHWPWTHLSHFGEEVDQEWENRDPWELGMIDVEGGESTDHEHIIHIGSRSISAEDNDEVFEYIADFDSYGLFSHPGRAWEGHETDDLAHFFETYYPEALGIDVWNQGYRSDDRELWTNLNREFLSGMYEIERPIWGFSNDDTTRDEEGDTGSDVDTNWNVFLLDELTREAFHDALENGRWYIQVQPEVGAEAPTIDAIEHDADEKTLTVEADNYDELRWLDENGSTIETSETFAYGQTNPGVFARVELESDEGEASSQPFQFNPAIGRWPRETGHTEATDRVETVAWSDDLFAYGGRDGGLHVHETGDEWEHVESILLNAFVLVARFDSDGDRLGLGSDDGELMIVDTSSWEVLETFDEVESDLEGFAWSPNDSAVAYGGEGGEVYVRAVEDWSPVTTLEEGDVRVEGVTWSDDYLAYGGRDAEVHIHEIGSADGDGWDHVDTFDDADEIIEAVEFSPSGDAIGYCSRDGRVYVRETDEWELIETINVGSMVRDIDWGGEDDWLACGSDDGALHVYETDAWQLVTTLDDIAERCYAVSFSADDAYLGAVDYGRPYEAHVYATPANDR